MCPINKFSVIFQGLSAGLMSVRPQILSLIVPDPQEPLEVSMEAPRNHLALIVPNARAKWLTIYLVG